MLLEHNFLKFRTFCSTLLSILHVENFDCEFFEFCQFSAQEMLIF